MNNLHAFLILIALLLSCTSNTETELRKLSTDEIVERLKNGKVDQFKFIYKDSIGNEITPEISSKFNQWLMIREFFVNGNNEIKQVRLFDYSHDRVFHEIQIRELLNHPLKGFEFSNIDCQKSESLLINAYRKDQNIRKMDSLKSTKVNIPNDDIVNLKTVISVIEKCGWPNSPDQIKSIFFVIQHAESEFMALYYSNFIQAVNEGLLKEGTMAKMKDRMLMNNGYPQIYGTQISGKSVFQLRDPKKVNEWRANVGLNTMEENTRKFGFEYISNDN